MTRRRTSVIGSSRGQAEPPPSHEALRDWTRLAVRELVLSLGLDAAEEARAWEDTARRWRIATGQEHGNPAPSAERSTVVREAPQGGETWWRKDYAARYSGLQTNETNVLKALGDQDTDGRHGLRDHVAHFEQRTKATRLARLSVRTKDAGPNLDMWCDFAPCAAAGGATLPLPVFAQPLFLAALARQSIIALDKLGQLGFVHGDFKPGNLCLAFPPAGQWQQARGSASGAWDLKALPLRLIDFEAGFAPGVQRLHHSGQNPNWSPYLQACYRRADAEPDGHTRQGLLYGIDWGSDLFALGVTLDDWCDRALAPLQALKDRTADHWGIDSAAHRTVQDTVSTQLPGLVRLRAFAQKLKDAEHPEHDAQQGNQAPRSDRPHARLWRELEADFKLGPGDSAQRLHFRLIVPTRPLAVAHGSRLRDRAALQARAGLRAAGAWVLRHRRAGWAVVAGAAVLAGATQARGAWAGMWDNTLQSMSDQAAYGLLDRVEGKSGVRARLAPALMALAGWVDDHQPVVITLAGLGWTPSLPADGSTPDVATLKAVRDANLRALAVLADAPDRCLQAVDGNTYVPFGHGLLRQAFESGQRLEQATGTSQPPDAPDAGAADLARLYQRTGWPMAALLHVHLRGCYVGGPVGQQAADLQPFITGLQALDPEQRVNRDFYIPSAHSHAQRLAAGQDACILPPPATGH